MPSFYPRRAAGSLIAADLQKFQVQFTFLSGWHTSPTLGSVFTFQLEMSVWRDVCSMLWAKSVACYQSDRRAAPIPKKWHFCSLQNCYYNMPIDSQIMSWIIKEWSADPWISIHIEFFLEWLRILCEATAEKIQCSGGLNQTKTPSKPHLISIIFGTKEAWIYSSLSYKYNRPPALISPPIDELVVAVSCIPYFYVRSLISSAVKFLANFLF